MTDDGRERLVNLEERDVFWLEACVLESNGESSRWGAGEVNWVDTRIGVC